MPTQPLFTATPKKVEHDSAIRDNRNHGRVGEWLQEKIAAGSRLSIVSAYFTVNAYQQLREELDSIESLRFLFGDPAYLRVKDEDKGQKNYRLTDEGLVMAAQVQQRAMAKACAEWLEKMAERAIGSCKLKRKRVIADRGCDSDHLGLPLVQTRHTPISPHRLGRTRNSTLDGRELCRSMSRWKVERRF